MKTVRQKPLFPPIASIAGFLLVSMICALGAHVLTGCIQTNDGSGGYVAPQPGVNNWVKAEVHRLDWATDEPIVERWNYDGAGRLVSVDERIACNCIVDLHRLSAHEYFPGGVVTTEDDDADGSIDRTTRYVINDVGLLEEFERSSESEGSRGTRYIYDRQNRLIETVDEDGYTESVTYEGNNITREYSDGQLRASYRYDANDRMLSAVHGENSIYSTTKIYKYDPAGRLIGEQSSSEGNPGYTTDFVYGSTGRLKDSLTQTSESAGELVVEEHYEYDHSLRLIWRSHTDHRSGYSGEESQSYDALGRPTSYESTDNGEVTWQSSRDWRVLSENEIEVVITSKDNRVERIVYRRLSFPPTTPPKEPRIRPEYPWVTPSFGGSFPLED